jgi:hypothetical protein
MVVWFCCYNSEGPYSLWLACCSVVFVFALSTPITGERLRRAQIITSWWPKQLNFHLWCHVCFALSPHSLFFIYRNVYWLTGIDQRASHNSDGHRSLQNCGFSVYTINLCTLLLPTCSVWWKFFRETGGVHRITYSFSYFLFLLIYSFILDIKGMLLSSLITKPSSSTRPQSLHLHSLTHTLLLLHCSLPGVLVSVICC